MCKLNQNVLSHIENNIVSYHIYRDVSSSMSVEDFESGFRYVASVAPPRAEHEAYYYRHHQINEVMMKFIIENDKLRAEFGTQDLFEKELQPTLIP